MGWGTLHYGIISRFKHWDCKGSIYNELVKFDVSYFVYDRFEEKKRIQREIPKSVGEI
jgi:hypothetical protein